MAPGIRFPAPHRYEKGNVLRLDTEANVALDIEMRVAVINDDMTSEEIVIENKSTLTNWTEETKDYVLQQGGFISDLVISVVTGQVASKGGVFATGMLGKGRINLPLCQGWCGGNRILTLGMQERIDYVPWPTADFSVTYQQANAAGGAIKLDISNANVTTSGLTSSWSMNVLTVTNSGTNGILARLYDSVANLNIIGRNFINVASGAGTSGALPSIGTAASTSANTPEFFGGATNIIVAGTESFSIEQTAAGAQNDTIQISGQISFYGQLPSFSVSRSTNAGNVNISAGAASFTIKG